ncbi:TPA: PRC-barrel domain-containing protein [Legionella pneumophila]|uniref:PRC-barrel domain-containing protein n=2 Tax=Legionella pneumophila TaxID=446 RepID=UPI000D8B1492|nr:PRC-barrel domain-containing protein [Legionella pneumophila]MDF1929974.1 PRC-barrel domain-containing protein [Legionella pneumophila]PYB49842.1 photosystem reaction center subunit H [Legionella pneumophila]TID58545.1 photosystem reaction center subunit H [Legionella pneumophila]TID75854.1 photosystem reaction center subunit H [Legionella pneumophila]TID76375.1 photosystem reaction center subunit H [Legionella pneumophila]
MTFRKVVKASEVTGVDVKNLTGEDLGKINEVVIDKARGKVSYLVLNFGGILGFGNKFFAIPWNMFTYNEEEDCFILDLDKERLKDAPGFDKDNWPNFTSPNVSTSIEQFYLKHKKAS